MCIRDRITKGVKVEEQAGDYIGMWTLHGKVYIKKRLSDELYERGLLREAIRRIQDLRKKKGLVETDRIELEVFAEKKLKKAIEKYRDELLMKVGADRLAFVTAKEARTRFKNTWEIENMTLGIEMKKK